MEAESSLTRWGAVRSCVAAIAVAGALVLVPGRLFERDPPAVLQGSARAALASYEYLLNDVARLVLALIVLATLGRRMRKAAGPHARPLIALGTLPVLFLLLAMLARLLGQYVLGGDGAMAYHGQAQLAALAAASWLAHEQAVLLASGACGIWTFIVLTHR